MTYIFTQIVTPLLRFLGNVCSGPEEFTQAALENPRLLICLGEFLDSPIKHIVKETLWALSNIVGRSSFMALLRFTMM